MYLPRAGHLQYMQMKQHTTMKVGTCCDVPTKCTITSAATSNCNCMVDTAGRQPSNHHDLCSAHDYIVLYLQHAKLPYYICMVASCLCTTSCCATNANKVECDTTGSDCCIQSVDFKAL